MRVVSIQLILEIFTNLKYEHYSSLLASTQFSVTFLNLHLLAKLSIEHVESSNITTCFIRLIVSSRSQSSPRCQGGPPPEELPRTESKDKKQFSSVTLGGEREEEEEARPAVKVSL